MGTVLTMLFFLALVFLISPAAAATKYVAEAWVLFDPEAVRVYEEFGSKDPEGDVRKDVEFHLTMTNEVFKTMKPYGLDIEIRVLGPIEYYKTNIYQEHDEHAPENLLKDLTEWLETDEIQARNVDYDIVILFTGFQFKGTIGIAHAGTICDPNYPTMADGFMTLSDMSTATTTAHEIAHTFGAMHDGKGSKKIMAEKDEKSAEGYYFSKCSPVDILEHFRDYSACLLKTKPSSWLPNLPASKYDGPLRDPGFVCRLSSRDAKMAPWYSSDDRKDLRCVTLLCSDGYFNRPAWVTEGTPCDKNKVCRHGECVTDPNNANIDVDPDCMYGDPAKVFFGDQFRTCNETVEEMGSQVCATLNEKCCATCPRLEKQTGVKGCYGDWKTVQYSNSPKMTCQEVIDKFGIDNTCKDFEIGCCETCAKVCRRDLGNLWIDGPDAMSCAEAFRVYDPKSLCTQDEVKEKCCKSCEKVCYGDKDEVKIGTKTLTCKEAFDSYVNKELCKNTDIQPRCCESCQKVCYRDFDGVELGNGRILTCAEAIAEYDPEILCGQDTFKSKCCVSCEKKGF